MTDAEKGDAVLNLWANFDKYKTIEDVAEAIKVQYEEVKKWSLLSRRLSSKIRDAQRSESTVLTNAHTRELMKYSHSVQDKLADVIIKKKISSHIIRPFLKSFDAKGNTIDGFHRLDADPNWKKLTVEHIDSEEKLLVARAVSNWNRRQVDREEKESWINGLAEIYSEQGYKVRGNYPPTGGNPENEIVSKIVAATGLASNTVMRYLDEDFKQTEQSRSYHPPQILASERIESTLGEEYVLRHEEEVKQKLIAEADLSPEEKQKLETERQQKLEEQKRKDEETKQKKKEWVSLQL